MPEPSEVLDSPVDDVGEFVSYPDSPFQLFQPYPPAGDQPEAIKLLCEGIEDAWPTRRCWASLARARPSPWPM